MKALQTIYVPFYKVFRGYGSTEREQAIVVLVLLAILMTCVALFGHSSHYLPQIEY